VTQQMWFGHLEAEKRNRERRDAFDADMLDALVSASVSRFVRLIEQRCLPAGWRPHKRAC
jgi:hypothetical protein